MLATLLVGGCGDNADDGGGGGNGGTSDPAAVCDDVDELRTSLAGLGDVSIDAGALATFQDQLDQVRSDVSTLINDAQDEYADEVDAVDQAVSDLTTTVRTAVDSPSAASLSAVRTARRVLTTSVSALGMAVQDTC